MRFGGQDRATSVTPLVVALALWCLLMAPSVAVFAQDAAVPVGQTQQDQAVAQTEARRATYRDALIRRAQDLGLHRARAWLALLHVKSGLLGSAASELQGRDFFLARDGARDPAAELDATVRAWFLPMPPSPQVPARQDGPTAALPEPATAAELSRDVSPAMDGRGRYIASAQHGICRFPARFLWLASQLELDFAALPAVQCAATQQFLQRVQAQSVTLVFSGYHLAAPASAFGHVFLRLNRGFESGQGRALELLDHAVDYSADVDDSNAVLYAFKGLLGRYPGTFHAMPYYYKVREYNDFESRDLWEYDLSLPPQQTAMLLAHLWEVGWGSAPYYYLGGNCAYHIMVLLDSVAPRLGASAGLGWPVLPANSVKRIAQLPGLVRQVRFRPSIRRQFQQRVAELSGDERARVADLVDQPGSDLAPLVLGRQAAVLDAAADLVDLRFARELLAEPDGKAGQLRRKLLERRANIAIPSPELVVPVPRDDQPDLAHSTRRLGIGGVWHADSGRRTAGATLDLRLTMHDLTDPPAGYPQLGQLEFLSVRGTWLANPGRFQLDRADLVHVASLQPLDRFAPKASWLFRVGADQRRDAICPDCTLATAQIAGGITLATTAQQFSIFAMTDVLVQAGPGAAALWPLVPVGVGAGPLVGVRWQPAGDLAFLATAAWRYYANASRGWVLDWQARSRWMVGRGFAVGAEASGSDARAQAEGMVYWYF